VVGVETPQAVRVRVLSGLALAVWAAAWPSPAQGNPQQAGVQVALRALGLYCGPIDGDFGPGTVKGIKAAQRRAHLAVTGLADVRTRVSLGPLGRPLFGERRLRGGDFGLDVSVLQYLLLERGLYRGALDGYLGVETEAAVRRYQRRARLGADGVVGPETLAALVRQAGVPVRKRVVRPAPIYLVRAGDTLTSLADRFGLSLTTLARVNRLDPSHLLLIGKRLVIPGPARLALESTPAGVRSRLDAWSARKGVSPQLVRALAWMESGFQPRVVSAAGARGVLQTLPSTRSFVEEVLVGHALPHSLDGDIEVGVLYLHHLLHDFAGDEHLALAAWYQGEASVRRDGLLPGTHAFVADVLALKERV
jgi:peptidoglycan hydrolase-like protein with peptidoglycan-binding domain